MSLHERLKMVIEGNTSGAKRYKELEGATGITAATWKTYLTRGVRPSADLVEAVAKAWPQYAFWMATGISDPQFGHVWPPKSALASERNEGCLPTVTRRAFTERIREGEIHPDDASLISKGLELMRDTGVIENDAYKAQAPSTTEMLEALRSIVVFLDNYVLTLDPDECIATYNFMRGRLTTIEQYVKEAQMGDLLNEVIRKFKAVKDEIEERLKWMSEGKPANRPG